MTTISIKSSIVFIKYFISHGQFSFSLTASGKCFLVVIGTWSVGKNRKSLRPAENKQLCIRIGSSVIASPRLVNLLLRYDFGKFALKK